jgi:hypothetical protein
MATRDPLADLKQMGQQYWQGLQDLGQQFLKNNPAAPASSPWAEGLEQWRTLYQGKDDSGVLGQILNQGKTWMSSLEQMFKSSAGGMGADLQAMLRESLAQFRSSQPWLGGLGQSSQWFDPAQMQQWAQNFGMPAAAGSPAHAPAFGFNREQQERFTELADHLVEYQRQTQRYQTLINSAMEGAIARMEHKLAQLDEPGRQLKTLKSVYDLWIDALEESYAEVALSPQFREAYGDLVNSQMRVRQGVQHQVERSTGDLGMPTRSELDGVHRKLAGLRRSVRQLDPDLLESLRSEIVMLKREVAELKSATRKAEMVVVKPTPARASSAAAPAPGKASPAPASKAKPAASTSAAAPDAAADVKAVASKPAARPRKRPTP